MFIVFLRLIMLILTCVSIFFIKLYDICDNKLLSINFFFVYINKKLSLLSSRIMLIKGIV